MQPPLWWGLQSVSLAALFSCCVLAFASSLRVGRSTSYGGFLFVIALGFWALAAGLATYMMTIWAEAWDGPPGWGDLFTALGWALLVASFYMLLLRFPLRDGGPGHTGLLMWVFPLGLGVAGAVAALLRTEALSNGVDADAIVRAIYLFLDGVMIGVFLLTVPVLVRLRRASLGLLFAALAVSLVLKSTGDILFLIWPVDNPLGLLVTALYPAAGAIALVGLAIHHIRLAPLTERKVLADPGFLEPQLVLRDTARRVQGLAGAFGSHLVLQGALQALRVLGVQGRIREGVLIAQASPEQWMQAVDAARRSSAAVLGPSADQEFERALMAYRAGGIEA